MRHSKKILQKIIADFNTVEIPSLNYGGCGIFALHLHKELAAKKVKSVPILLSQGQIYAYVADTINVHNDIPSGYINHIVLKIGKWFVDSDGIYKTQADIDRGYYEYNNTIALPIKTLENVVASDRWNPEFRRHIYEKDVIANIKTAVSKNLSPKLDNKMTLFPCMV